METEAHKRKMAMGGQKQRLERCGHKLRNAQDCWHHQKLGEAKRTLAGASGGRVAPVAPGCSISSSQNWESKGFCCCKPPSLLQQPQEGKTGSSPRWTLSLGDPSFPGCTWPCRQVNLPSPSGLCCFSPAPPPALCALLPICPLRHTWIPNFSSKPCLAGAAGSDGLWLTEQLQSAQ